MKKEFVNIIMMYRTLAIILFEHSNFSWNKKKMECCNVLLQEYNILKPNFPVYLSVFWFFVFIFFFVL